MAAEAAMDRGYSESFMVMLEPAMKRLNRFLVKANVRAMPQMPASIPMGMPMRLSMSASVRTVLLSCLFVAPTEDRRPNCFVLSLMEILNALYMRDIDPNTISPMSMAESPFITSVKFESFEIPEYIRRSLFVVYKRSGNSVFMKS